MTEFRGLALARAKTVGLNSPAQLASRIPQTTFGAASRRHRTVTKELGAFPLHLGPVGF